MLFQSWRKILKYEKYPFSKTEYILDTLRSRFHFTKIDLNQEYRQMSVDEHSQELLLINNPNGLFQFLYLSIGLTSSPAIWHEQIIQIVHGIEDVIVFIDDIGVAV